MNPLVPGEQLGHQFNGSLQSFSFSLSAEASVYGYVELWTGGRNPVAIDNFDTIILTSKYWEVLLAEGTVLIQVLKSKTE